MPLLASLLGHVFRMKWDHFFGHASTLEVSFATLNNSILDRLDIFSDAINLKNTLVLLFSGETTHVDSFEALYCKCGESIQDLV